MDIKYELIEELYELVKVNYEKENYEQVAGDVLKHLSDALKERFEIDQDGLLLIDEILNTVYYLDQLNNVYSDLFRTSIKGVLFYFMGFYLSYEQSKLNKNTYYKDDIDILLINANYLLCKADNKKRRFDLDEHVKGLKHPSFEWDSECYYQLVDLTPRDQYQKVVLKIIEILDDTYFLIYLEFFQQLINALNEEELKDVYELMGEKILNSTYRDLDIYLDVLPGKYFEGLNEEVKVYLENLLFDDFVKGRYDLPNDRRSEYGYVVPFLYYEYFNYFDKKKWTDELIRKLKSNNNLERDYAIKFMFDIIEHINKDDIEPSLYDYLYEALRGRDEYFTHYFKESVFNSQTHPWAELFKRFKI